MFQCLDCNYKSNRKYNLQLHYKNKHKKEVKANEIEKYTNVNPVERNVNSKQINVNIETKNLVLEKTNVNPVERNVNLKKNENLKIILECEKKCPILPMDLTCNEVLDVDKNEKLKIIFECEKCQKKFKTNQGLKRHNCNGVSNPLECQYCHLMLSCSSAKSRHIKICKIKQAQIIVKEYETKNNIVNHNISSTTNQQQNNMVINYNFYNGKNLIDYESDDDKYDITKICNFGEERTEYIGDDMMKRMALQLNVRKLIELKHFNKEHPENHNIRKNDDKSLKVLINNEWKVESKNEIMNQIFNKSKAELYLCSLEKIFNKELGEMATDEKISQWLEYEKKSKKKVIEFIEIQITEILKKRRKELGLMLEEKRLIGM